MAVSSLSGRLEAPEPISDTNKRVLDDPSRHIRTQFLRRVAHDIASPGGVIFTVLEELASSDRPRPELIAMAKRSLRRLTRLSDQLALVAELEANELEPDLAATDLCALTKHAMDDALAIDARRDIVTNAHIPDAPLLTAGDSRLLHAVLRELISNALKLATSRVELTLSAGDGLVTLRIEDDGPGFSDESASSLGRRFVERSAARGLGLSLSMAIEILRAHGGALLIEESTLPPGRRGTPGAAVVVTLPRAPNDT